jgi:hypothetical protein
MMSGQHLAQKPSIIRLFARRALESRTPDDLVEWAVSELVDGLDTPHLRILAGLTKPLYWSEVEEIFARALEELGLSEPSSVESLWRYALFIAQHVIWRDARPRRLPHP